MIFLPRVVNELFVWPNEILYFQNNNQCVLLETVIRKKALPIQLSSLKSTGRSDPLQDANFATCIKDQCYSVGIIFFNVFEPKSVTNPSQIIL